MICQTKITLKDGILAPCGRCIICKMLNKKDWQFRLWQELKSCKSAKFITLTYAPQFIPRTEEGRSTLNKNEIQKFIKRLRDHQRRENIKLLQDKYPLKSLNEIKLLEKKFPKIRYYLVGEYGTNTFRPHYHALIFNATETIENKIPDIWGLGSVDLGTVNPKSINYVADYVQNKKVPKYRPKHKQHEFMLCSKKPIIGYDYLKNKEYHKKNNLLSVRNQEGNYQRLPQCYKSKFFTPIHLEHITMDIEIQAIENDKIETERLIKLGNTNAQSYKNQQVIHQIEKLVYNNSKKKKPI